MNRKKRKIHLSSSQIIMTGFMLLIMTGAVLLMLPVSSQAGVWTPFADALFTSTSASCVTGLVVHDTATYWSPFGQLVIMLLIQVGGMGVVTMAIAVFMASGRKISLSQRRLMQDSISAQQVGGIVRMTGFIIKVSLTAELIGATVLSFVFVPEFGPTKGLWYAVFHSVSAFCNAGFDLMGVKGRFSSLTGYASNLTVNLTVVFLILFGGIGFSVWADISGNKLDFKKYRLQTKIVLVMTALLVILPAVYFFAVEFSSPQWKNMTFSDRAIASLFRAVTPRTAGFNTVDMSLFSEATVMITIMLMLTGGCPGSTAGGMKTTTLAVLAANMIATFRRQSSPVCFGRRIDDKTIKNAATIFMMYITLFMGGAVVISVIDGLPLLTSMFETASAVATVGLTLGITPQLSYISRFILICLMYLGRVGGLTIVFATVKGVDSGSGRYPQEKITTG